MQVRRKIVLILAVFLSVHVYSASQGFSQIVFDNTADVGSVVFGPDCCLTGQEVSLGGAATLNQIEWFLSGQFFGVDSADIQFAIYENDGVDGQPNTLLWDQTFLELSIAPGPQLVSFAIPNINVPSTITVVSRILDSDPIATGNIVSNSTNIGEENERWILDNGTWSVSNNSLRAFRLTAVPEPSSAVLLLLSIIVLSIRRSRK